MKIIFLDIDGVLNNDNHIYHYGNNYIDNNLLNLFVAVLKSTKSEVVLSCGWKINDFKLKTLTDKLSRFEINILDIINSNKDGWINAQEEIKKWLKNHPQVSKYCIISSDFDVGQGLKNFFRTDSELGLTEDSSIDVIDYMNYAYETII